MTARTLQLLTALLMTAPLFGRSRVDDCPDFQDFVRRETAFRRVFTNHIGIRRNVDADLVVRNIALYPLNLGSQVAEDAA